MTPHDEILSVIDGDSEGCVVCGDALEMLKVIPDGSVQMCVTSPPYWGLRNYNVDGQIGLEKTPELFVTHLVEVFREVRRVLRDDGTVWLNMGDSYTSGGRPTRDPGKSTLHPAQPRGTKRADTPPGLKPKDLCGIPWRVAFALQADGWWLRQDIIWAKPNPMPESCRDRCTKAHEYIFLLAKNQKYFYDAEAIREPGEGYGRSENFRDDKYTNNRSFKNSDSRAGDKGGGRPLCDGSGRNKRSVWTIATQAYPKAHFATFPQLLVEPCILAGTSEKGCCPKCRTPWARVVERQGEDAGQVDAYGKTNARAPQDRDFRLSSRMAAARAAGGDHDNPFPKMATLGWEPQCACGGEPIPCTVLDPFIGSGTVAKVAAGLGRDYIGIELNPEYAAMARKRVYGPLFGAADMAARGIDHA